MPIRSSLKMVQNLTVLVTGEHLTAKVSLWFCETFFSAKNDEIKYSNTFVTAINIVRQNRQTSNKYNSNKLKADINPE